MALLVQKFGGTSVGDLDRIDGVAARVAATVRAGHEVIVVVSAMAGETDRLLNLALAASPHGRPNPRELDVILSTGEAVTTALLAMSLESHGITASSWSGRQAGIRTDNRHARARISAVDPAALLAEAGKGRVPVVAGFQGETEDGHVTTLGRGGSDTTAVALAAATGADECQIFTDVDGVYTADPRVVPEARRLDRIGFEEMLEMAGQGSKVLQIRSVEFARKHGVRLRVLSTFEKGEGTLVAEIEESAMEEAHITGIACSRNEALLRIGGLPDGPDIASRVVGPLAKADVPLDMIFHNVARDGTIDFTVTMGRDDYEVARERLAQAFPAQAAGISGNRRVAKVSLIGVGVKSHASIAARLFEALAQAGINILLSSTTQVRISVLVDESDADNAVRALHNQFELHHP
ncbi:MAG: aspartate kinase [Gammaproteobacteria bacterium]|nr:aspartate kinase [Gammaproteobacteria bacterium]